MDGQVAAGTRIEKVMASVRQRIASRSLVPGARLPSVRALAKTMQVSTSTVVEAYDRLVADGTISSRPGSGFSFRARLRPCRSPISSRSSIGRWILYGSRGRRWMKVPFSPNPAAAGFPHRGCRRRR